MATYPQDTQEFERRIAMINSKGDWVYSCAEIGAALGINPNTVRAAAKRLFGNFIKNEFTLDDCRKIKAYFESVTAEQEEMRIKALYDALNVSEVNTR